MQFNIYKQFKYFLMIVLLVGCGESTRKKMGIINTPPDEFQVYKQKDLTVPPNYELRAPGSDSNSDRYKINNSENLLFSEEEKGELSINDEILLMSVEENKVDNNIREIINDDNAIKEVDQSTLDQILDFDRVFDADEKPNVIDPNEEKERLEKLKSEIQDIENNIEKEENKNKEDNKYEQTTLHSIATEHENKNKPESDKIENEEDESFLDKIFDFDIFGSEEDNNENQRDTTFFEKNKKESE